MINLDDKNVNSISDEGFLDVSDFAHYLNKVLENNGYRPVDIYLDQHVKCTLKENKIKLSNEFCLQTKKSVNLISKRFA